MIHVSKTQLNQVEYLIGQSILGNHVLFDNDTLRDIFSKRGKKVELENEPETDEEGYSVEHHIERLIMQPSIAQKRAYLEKLDKETFEKVVRTYFSIVENNLFEQLEAKH